MVPLSAGGKGGWDTLLDSVIICSVEEVFQVKLGGGGGGTVKEVSKATMRWVVTEVDMASTESCKSVAAARRHGAKGITSVKKLGPRCKPTKVVSFKAS